MWSIKIVETNIHLCALFRAQDIKTYGFDTILEPIISDLKVLETSGITSPMFKNPVRGSIVQVTGDNLGTHGMFGFVESFSARNCCRFCVIEKSEFQTVFCENEDSMMLRSIAALYRQIHNYLIYMVWSVHVYWILFSFSTQQIIFLLTSCMTF